MKLETGWVERGLRIFERVMESDVEELVVKQLERRRLEGLMVGTQGEEGTERLDTSMDEGNWIIRVDSGRTGFLKTI